MTRNRNWFAVGIVISLFLIAGCTSKPTGQVIIEKKASPGISTFATTNDEICTDTEGRPIIRMFSTSWCPHCKWVKPIYTQVVKEYATAGKITAHLWEVDLNDNLLTEEKDPIPTTEQAIYEKYNPEQSIPTFVFGCKYTRVGNGYELQDDTAAEEAEFRLVIDQLLKEVTP